MQNNQPSNTTWDALWFNARIATMCDGETAFGLREDSAIGINQGVIAWIGAAADIPPEQLRNCADQFDCESRLVTPGLIDCHTHLIYGGNRTNEFEMRLKGATYQEISLAGGGIASTVAATRASDQAALFDSAKRRLQSFLDEGVTTIEVKSGYGLDLENEAKMLRVARQLGEQLPLDVVTTFLGAHATPPEFQGANDDYIDYVCGSVLPAIAAEGLADSVDAFCENIAFSAEQVERVFKAAKQHSLPIKLHAEQLSDQKGAVLAAKMGALSVDHIEFLAPEDITNLKQSGTVAVLLPGAFYFLRETKLPPIDALRENGVPIAIASDSNPGSSPVSSLLLMLSMACTLFKLTPEESLAGVTRNAAMALGIDDNAGTLEPGKVANMVLWDLQNPAELSYRIGHNPCVKVMYKGAIR
ncbi:MAG: imidazolonepropionase [Cryomorphaceae bacterium]|jgi:imidazolonepropionase